MQDESFGTFRKGFQHPRPPSCSTPALVFNYTLSYSCLRAWIPQVFSNCLDALQFTSNGEALTLFNMSNLSVMKMHKNSTHTSTLSIAPVALSWAKLSQVSNWDVIFTEEDALPGIIQHGLATRFHLSWISSLSLHLLPWWLKNLTTVGCWQTGFRSMSKRQL